MSTLIYFLLQATAQIREGEGAGSALGSVLRTVHCPTVLGPPCTHLAKFCGKPSDTSALNGCQKITTAVG